MIENGTKGSARSSFCISSTIGMVRNNRLNAIHRLTDYKIVSVRLTDLWRPAFPTPNMLDDILGQCIADPILKELRFYAPPHWQHALLSTCATFPVTPCTR